MSKNLEHNISERLKKNNMSPARVSSLYSEKAAAQKKSLKKVASVIF
ncbi:hypothetical protein JHL18_11500 [Clostridium sp. YIM B02505]|uniref:Uncharacterized protein n=1 Tax=Clostridium yunnanense TaxID=2800325 RepID=A0ABS1EPG7_9CLOT|nr:hypothetical protein [Clostridium yunnanense]MBK1811250.1 hypothetical protein [Clostridium yunnanense]